MNSSVTPPAEKSLDNSISKLDRGKEKLIESLNSGDFRQQRTRVAYILNIYPETRNSDVTLSLRYWQVFQPELYNPHGIRPQDLFKLERLHYIVRARAKIQNEYKLFQANSDIKRKRRKHEETISDEVVNDQPPVSMVHVFSDESGKTQKYVLVGSVWVLTARAVYTVSRAIDSWKENSNWKKREIHFSRFGKGDFDTLKEFLEVVNQNREFLSFKAIAVERSKTKRSVEEVVTKLHEEMLLSGLEHELGTMRITPPQIVNITLDEEQSLDAITLNDSKRALNTHLHAKYRDAVKVEGIQTVSSKSSALVQLSDLIVGALNRKLNNESQERKVKDELADLVIESLGLNLSPNSIDGLDSTALFVI